VAVSREYSLTAKQQRFAVEYCVDWNATQAAKRAGYSEITAYQSGSENLKNPQIVAAIEERKAELAAAAGLSREWVLRQWRQIAEADPNELTQVRRVNCRHCYGVGHGYQWIDEAEFVAAFDVWSRKHPEKQGLPPDGLGGFGFDVNREPASDCPACFGDGFEVVHIADTRKLKGSARRLFAGVERTKEGLKIKMRDQDAALKNISGYFGMLVERKEISGPGGSPVQVAVTDLSDEQLAALIVGEAPPVAD